MKTSESPARVMLYHMLAEAVSEPMEWLAQPGHQWPLFDALVEVASDEQNAALREILVDLAGVSSETLVGRRKRYQDVIIKPTVSLYESLAIEGRLSGGATFAVWNLYRSVGLDVPAAMLPDYVGVELSFLAHLVEREHQSPDEAAQWRRARHLFVKRHAGKWMPALGQALARTGDPVYSPIGRLLKIMIELELNPPVRKKLGAATRLPAVVSAETCSMCSFCAQVCPTHALAVHETDETTSLLLNDSKCISCGKCVRVCPVQTLQLSQTLGKPDWRVLVQSPRSHCPGCGIATVSEAELNAVSETIGTPHWLKYCMDCRPYLWG